MYDNKTPIYKKQINIYKKLLQFYFYSWLAINVFSRV